MMTLVMNRPVPGPVFGRLLAVVVMVWVYYSAQIFLMGAELTWAYARRFGSMKDFADTGSAPAGL